jgi:uncharacterized membrane protein YfcA
MSPTAIILVFLIITGAAALQGAVGYGLNVIAAPLLMLINPAMVPGPILASAFVLTALMVWRNRDGIDLHGVRWMVFGMIPGTVLASWLLPSMPVRSLSFVLAGLVIGGVVLSLTGLRFPPLRWILLTAGFVSGMGSTLASIGGPPVALVNQELPGPRLRATLSTYFIISAVFSLLGLVIAGHYGGSELSLSAVMLPGVVVGFLLSKPLAVYLDKGYTRYAILGVSGLAGVLLLIQQLASR